MDFLNMNFSELFLEKHGKAIYNKICMIIKEEKPNKYDNYYIASIFKLAFLDFWGLNAKQIKELVVGLQPKSEINVNELKKLHKNSILEIKKCLESVMPNTK